jgi:polyvinyl alcohol dehydrogenase (cytochrome)
MRQGFLSTQSMLRLLFISYLVLFSLRCQPPPDPGTPVWSSWGGDLHNTHHAANETRISPANVHTLVPAWITQTNGNVSAIPTVTTTLLYVPDWGVPLLGSSSLYTFDRLTGKRIAKKGLLTYTGNLFNPLSRSSPAIWGDLLIFGDVRSQPSSLVGIPGAHGARLYAINRSTYKLIWKTTLDPHPMAIVTQSPVVHDGRVYIGVSSAEEAAAKLGYKCCSFRGSMLALDVATGKILWRKFTIPEPTPGTPVAIAGNALRQYSKLIAN